MTRDRRYKTVKILIANGEITLFNQIFDHIPKTIVAADMGIQNIRFSKLMNNTEDFTYKETFQLGKLFDLDERTINELVVSEYLQQKVKKT